MKRIGIIVGLFFVVAINIHSKTTYIPTYLSYLHIITNGDTLAVANNLDTLELADPEGMFTMRIDQENVTSEKVKAIKRKKAAAGWMTFAAVMGGAFQKLLVIIRYNIWCGRHIHRQQSDWQRYLLLKQGKNRV